MYLGIWIHTLLPTGDLDSVWDMRSVTKICDMISGIRNGKTFSFIIVKPSLAARMV